MIWNVQLVFDCEDPDELMIFWGHALKHPWLSSMDVAALREWRKDWPQYDGRGRIDDAPGRHMSIYIQAVPEPKIGRNRLRLELAASDEVEARRDVEALGAGSTADELQDVEGNEFTIVGGLRIEGVERVFPTVVLDCLDSERMIEFWAEATGYREVDRRLEPVAGTTRVKDGWIVVGGQRVMQPRMIDAAPDREVYDLTPGLAFNTVEEPKRGKNRLHLDLHATDVDDHRARLEKLGATVQRWDTDHVLLDPEGNEFCLN